MMHFSNCMTTTLNAVLLPGGKAIYNGVIWCEIILAAFANHKQGPNRRGGDINLKIQHFKKVNV